MMAARFADGCVDGERNKQGDGKESAFPLSLYMAAAGLVLTAGAVWRRVRRRGTRR